MTQQLPPRASLDWLRKTAKQNLAALRAGMPDATLADAQLALARDYGFPSWRALKAKIEGRAQAPDDAATTAFMRLVGDGETERVRAALADAPALAIGVGPHPYWGGRPQALHVAVETRGRDMARLLLDAGADPNGRNGEYDLWSPLMLAINRADPEMRNLLLGRGARIGLVEALLMKDDAAVDALLGGGLPSIVPNNGSILAFARTPYAIDRLLELGAPIDLADRWGTTPVEAMSRAGADGGSLVRHMMARGVTPDPEAFARLGDRDMLAAMAETDPDVLRRDAILMAAVEFRHCALVRWLLSTGASANARTGAQSRQSALHNAAWNGDLEMVKLLVEHGADLHARDGEHDATPRAWAETAINVTNNPDCAGLAAWLMAQGG